MKSKNFFSYPNPASNRMTIVNPLENNENGTLEVYDVTGKKILQKQVNGNNDKINVDTASLSNGTYIYKINDFTNRFVKK